MSGFNIEDLITDDKLEVEGVWHGYKSDSEVKVARWQNDEFQKMMRVEYKREKYVLEAEDETSVKVMKRITGKVMAHTILKDIRGMTYKGQPLVYTPALGIELFARIEDFQDDIQKFAQDAAAYRTRQEDAAVKE